MFVDVILSAALKHYSSDYRDLLNYLTKISNQLTFTESETDLPLLIFKEKNIYLWVKDNTVSAYPFLFSLPNEILFITQQFLSSGDNIYISKSLPSIFQKQLIEKNIEISLLENKEDDFRYWVKQLKKFS